MKKIQLTPLSQLRTRLRELAYIRSTIALLHWDEQTMMPEKSSQMRAEMLAYLSGLAHNALLRLNEDGILDELRKQQENKKLSARESALVREVWRDYTLATKLPEEFVKEFAQTASKTHHIWALARKHDDFASYRGALEKIVRLCRTRAELLGGGNNPYNTLLDEYEPGITVDTLSIMFEELKQTLVPLVQAINQSKVKVPSVFKGIFSLEMQKNFIHDLASYIEFDLAAGRIDQSVHPFSSGFHPQDVRITTRYDLKNPWYAIGSTIHEAGHGIYEQGLPYEEFGTPLGEAASYGIHESQSRLWENMIGKSKEFWSFLYPKLKKAFPQQLKSVSLDDFYRAINASKPSLIRTESDEVTYNLHIIVRFEIEKDMLEGTIAIKDLPHVWNEKMRQYLGVTVPNDSQGVLQDVHWSEGAIGYFPSYTLGNIYSAQIFEVMKKDIKNYEQKVRKGQFKEIKEWLRTSIHRHGRHYRPEELLQKITGSGLSIGPFAQYLTYKYKKLYKL